MTFHAFKPIRRLLDNRLGGQEAESSRHFRFLFIAFYSDALTRRSISTIVVSKSLTCSNLRPIAKSLKLFSTRTFPIVHHRIRRPAISVFAIRHECSTSASTSFLQGRAAAVCQDEPAKAFLIPSTATSFGAGLICFPRKRTAVEPRRKLQAMLALDSGSGGKKKAETEGLRPAFAGGDASVFAVISTVKTPLRRC